ncbi:MAG: ATP-binding protein [Acidimicrobiales bacterium]
MSDATTSVVGPPGRGARRLGLRKRLVVIFAVGALLLSASVAVISYELARSGMIRLRQTSSEQQAFVNARLVRSRLRLGDPDIAALLTSMSPRSTSSHLLLRDAQWTTGGSVSDASLISAAMREVVAQGHAGWQFVRVDGQPRLMVGVPIAEFDAQYFAIYRVDVLDRTLRVMRTSLVVAAIATTLVGAAAGWWVSRRVLRPLADVSTAAAAVTTGRLDARLDVGTDPDLATVASSFNRMTEALQTRIQRDARFASAVSHELRSPLSTLVAAVDVMAGRRDELSAPAREALDLLAAEVGHLRRLVEDLLEISRLEAGVADVAMEEVRLEELVHHAVDSTTSRPVPVEIDDAAGSTIVRADKRRLERVLGNLISNAEQYAGGPTRVAVERRPNVAWICVEDAGPGVPPEEREQIFERFVRGRVAGARRPQGGAGLGLSLVSEHVRVHHGRVWVEDRAGGGARFVVELPVSS